MAAAGVHRHPANDLGQSKFSRLPALAKRGDTAAAPRSQIAPRAAAFLLGDIMYDDLENEDEMDDISDDLREIMERQQEAKRAYDTACDNEDAVRRDYFADPCPRTLKGWKAAKRAIMERHEACEELAREFADAWEYEHGFGR